MLFDISRFMLYPRYIHYELKHNVAVKTTIDKQSPHAKLLLKSGVLQRSHILLKLYILNENKFIRFNLCRQSCFLSGFPRGGVLPYIGYTGMCRWGGYGFQAIWSGKGYGFQTIWPGKGSSNHRKLG